MALAACTSPSNVLIELIAYNSLHLAWDGAASSYKLAYKKEEATTYTTLSKTGPGSSGGSGLNPDDTGGSITSTSPNATADFILPGLDPGVYDVRLINICVDGSSFVLKKKALVSVPTGLIPNFRLTNTKLSRYQFSFSWETPSIDNGNFFLLSWCELNEFGKSLECESAQIASSERTYTIEFPQGKVFKVLLSTAVNDYEYAVSDALIIDTENMTCCALEPPTQVDSGGDTAIVTGVSNIISDEVPAGAKNGSNVTYVTEFDFVPESVEVEINGIGQEPTIDFHTVGTKNIIMHVAPLVNDTITTDYLKQP